MYGCYPFNSFSLTEQNLTLFVVHFALILVRGNIFFYYRHSTAAANSCCETFQPRPKLTWRQTRKLGTQFLNRFLLCSHYLLGLCLITFLYQFLSCRINKTTNSQNSIKICQTPTTNNVYTNCCYISSCWFRLSLYFNYSW